MNQTDNTSLKAEYRSRKINKHTQTRTIYVIFNKKEKKMFDYKLIEIHERRKL